MARTRLPDGAGSIGTSVRALLPLHMLWARVEDQVVMRVLLAIDGSEHAHRALELVTAAGWPPGSAIRIVAMLDRPLPMIPAPGMALVGWETLELEQSARMLLEGAIDDAVSLVRREGRNVGGAVVAGRPGTLIIDEASRWRADLVVVGNRGRGPFAAMLLGSVSAEVVDHAPCPVLVARGASVERVLFATDGSSGAGAAESLLLSWALFQRSRITVVSVADAVGPWQSGFATTMYAEAPELYDEMIRAARSEHERVAQESARRLREAGLDATYEVHQGHPAQEIVRIAEERAFDLVVTGTRGRGAAARLLLGSVARSVLHHAHCSVLVTHERPVEAEKPR